MRLAPFLFLVLFTSSVYSQEERTNDQNFINWAQFISKYNLNPKWSLHVEYQWRRTEGLRAPQQHLIRTGATYQAQENISFHAGYAWVNTYPYGDYPIAANGTFPEHRLYQQFVIKQRLGQWALQQRFRLEQRWLAKLSASNGTIEDWIYLNRFRYQFRAQYHLRSIKKLPIHLIAWNELFIGSGKNLGVNIFDQNRFAFQIGLKISKNYSLEVGYLNQILQQGKRIDSKTILQRNRGFLLSTYLEL